MRVTKRLLLHLGDARQHLRKKDGVTLCSVTQASHD
jgi:hypothetical protein